MNLHHLLAAVLVIANAALAGLIWLAESAAPPESMVQKSGTMAERSAAIPRGNLVAGNAVMVHRDATPPENLSAPPPVAGNNAAKALQPDASKRQQRKEMTDAGLREPRTGGCAIHYWSASVARATLTTAIRDREPVDRICAVERPSILFFSELRGLKGREIRHRWIPNGQVRSVKPFKIGGDRWRVWSAISFAPAWAGTWTVEVVDERGQVLAAERFLYRPNGTACRQPDCSIMATHHTDSTR